MRTHSYNWLLAVQKEHQLLTFSFWREFLGAFSQGLSATSEEEFSRAWKSSGDRTAFYEGTLLESVSEAMGLTFKKEEFKVDYTFCATTTDYDVPMVFVESENVATSAHHEMRKLCCLHAPLKVLIVCAEWSNEPGAWNHGGYQDRLLKEWGMQIRAHNKVWPSPSITGVIVAEWNESLKFYAVAFDHFGDVVDEHRVVFEHGVS